jgi:hypothetical protein
MAIKSLSTLTQLQEGTESVHCDRFEAEHEVQ